MQPLPNLGGKKARGNPVTSLPSDLQSPVSWPRRHRAQNQLIQLIQSTQISFLGQRAGPSVKRESAEEAAQGQTIKDPWALPSSLDSVLQTGGNHKRSLSREMTVKWWFGGREPKLVLKVWSQTSSLCITERLIRNAHSWVPSLTYWIRNYGHGPNNLYFSKQLQVSYGCWRWSTTNLEHPPCITYSARLLESCNSHPF